jgi:hypothetical protein
MKKLSDITRRENCFFTRDGHVLKTVKDMLDYLMECDELNYSYHVNAQKNDFANWVSDVLLAPELGKNLMVSKNLIEARDAILAFLQAFDYQSKGVSDDKAFHTVDDYKLKNVQELYYYINNCDDGSFNFHFNAQKNDFANWVSDVLIFPSLSAKMRAVHNRFEMVAVLKEFLLSSAQPGANPEYERYANERILNDKKAEPENVNVSQNNMSQNKPEVSNANTKTLSGEETINLKSLDLTHEEEEEEKNDGPFLDKSAFRQFTDEELDKFTSFARRDKVVDVDAKAEYLKTVLQELKNMVKELRRAERDPFIADLMLRSLTPKIDYYALSKNPEDYNHIVRSMRDIQHEIEECSTQNAYNIADEIMKDLKLQGIALKKA